MMHMIIVILVVSLTACTSNYGRFYTPNLSASPEMVASKRAGPPPQTPVIEYSPPRPDWDQYTRRGYVSIGYSSFNSGQNESDQGAIEQGKKVGADLIVIVNPSYTGSVTTHVPITTPTTSTSYTSGSAMAFGSGGTATAFGNATTTMHGSRTSYVPMNVNRYDYGAMYFVKWTFTFGAMWRDLTNEERAALQSNSGVYIISVVNDTPAYRHDVLVGDIIMKVDGISIYGTQSISDAITKKRGQEVNLTIFRNGQLI